MARRRMAVADVKEILVAWDAGEGISAIARVLGYTRPTVRKYVQAASQVGLTRGGGRRSEADWERLAREALARVTPHRAPGAATAEVARHHATLERQVGQVQLAVLHQRLRDEQGLRVSWRTFYRYVAAHWPERLQRGPRVTVRLDDPPPGDEAQVDFFYAGLWVDPDTGRQRRLYAFLMTLAHSRHQFLYPVLAEDSTAWLEGHVAAFTFFGGVPRRLVPDNLTAGVRKADRYDPRLNRAYGELARYYGALVDPTRVRHPQDKPRVERGVSYARESFFCGRTFPTLAAWRGAAAGWCREVAGQRVHGTTGERPLVAFAAREQPALQPLPARPWELVTWASAQVHADCHLQVAGARYSVPYRFVGQQLDIRLGQTLVEIYDGATLITTHPRQAQGRATRLDHYPAAGQAFLRATPAACLQQAQGYGAATAALVAGLLETGLLTQRREAQAILRLAERYDPARLEEACRRALAAGDGRHRTVRGILEGGHDLVPPAALPSPQPIGAFLRGPAAFLVAAEEGER
jgi:transposase